MVDRLRGLWLAAALLVAAPLGAQEQAAACGTDSPPACAIGGAAATALAAQTSILLVGGSPGLSVGGEGGIRLGALPGVSVTARAGVARLRLPHADDPMRQASGLRGVVAATLGWRFFDGVALAPTLAGVGSLELLGTAGVLTLSQDELTPEAWTTAGFGAGVRVGILRESFTTPGASVSVMYHRIGDIGIEAGARVSELAVDTNPEVWSTRAVVGKRLGGVAVSGGVGYDLVGGEREFSGATSSYRDDFSENGRWSAFAGLSRPFVIGALAAELGWASGGDRPSGYPADAEFDPTRGTWFGSLGVRLAL